MTRIIDLSVPLRNDPAKVLRAQIEYQDHEAGAKAFAPVFNLDYDKLPEGKFCAVAIVED